MQYDTDGRLLVADGDIVAVGNGLPYTETGALAVESAAVISTQNGFPYTEAGKLAVSMPAPPDDEATVQDGQSVVLRQADGSSITAGANLVVEGGALTEVAISPASRVIVNEESYEVGSVTYTFTVEDGVITDIVTS